MNRIAPPSSPALLALTPKALPGRGRFIGAPDPIPRAERGAVRALALGSMAPSRAVPADVGGFPGIGERRAIPPFDRPRAPGRPDDPPRVEVEAARGPIGRAPGREG